MNSVSPVTHQPAHRTSPKPQGCTNLLLRQLTRRVTQRYDAAMALVGLKTTQYSLLSHVIQLEPVRPGDLAQAMEMDPSTLTRNLKPLIAAGWVQLAAGADGRSRTITATAAGRVKRVEAQSHWKQAQVQLNQTLGLSRVVDLHAMLQQSLAILNISPSGVDHG